MEKIFIVDDNLVILDVLLLLFEIYDFDVVMVSNFFEVI